MGVSWVSFGVGLGSMHDRLGSDFESKLGQVYLFLHPNWAQNLAAGQTKAGNGISTLKIGGHHDNTVV